MPVPQQTAPRRARARLLTAAGNLRTALAETGAASRLAGGGPALTGDGSHLTGDSAALARGGSHLASGGPALTGGGSRLTGGGVVGNERLTAVGGVVLIVLLAALGVTILRVRLLIEPHLFIGLLLLPPIALKLGSTGYRFARYYTGSAIYRHRGAPPLALRALGPAVVASTLAVFATGVVLLAEGPGASGTLRTLHKASFIVWIGVTALHVLGHLPDLARLLVRRGERYEYNRLAAGGAGRAIALAGALVAGLVLAILLIPHFGGWSHFEAVRHDH